MLKPHAHRPDLIEVLKAELAQPSLYDEVVAALFRAGFDISEEVLDRDMQQAYRHDESVQAAWKTVYENPQEYWTLYELAEKLVDLKTISGAGGSIMSPRLNG